MATFEEKLAQKRADYAKAFRIEELNDANDKSNLDMMLKTEIMVDDIQERIKELMEEDAVGNVSAVKKLSDLLKDARDTVLAIQRTLAIDRKTRRSEETASVADYIRDLKKHASEFMAQRIVRVYCPDCNVMVGRIYPVHDHTAFNVSFQCDQCNKFIRARREEKDIFFDVRDSDWRRKYKAQVIQPKKARKGEDIFVEDELVINAEPDVAVDEAVPLERADLQDDLEIGQEEEDVTH
jgi:hypothetical protein